MHHSESAPSEEGIPQARKLTPSPTLPHASTRPLLVAPASLASWLRSKLKQYKTPVIIEHGKETAAQEILSALDEMRDALLPLQGQLVLLKETTGRNFLTLLFGLIEARAIIAPISPETSQDELHHIAHILQASHIVSWCEKEHTLKIEKSSQALPDQLSFISRMDTGPAFIRFTSGTTGSSKGVLICEESALFRAQSAAKGLSLLEGDRVLWLLPMEYHFVAMLLAVIDARATFVVEPLKNEGEDPSTTVIYCSPKEIREMLCPKYLHRFLKLSSVLCTTGPLFHHERTRFLDKFRLPVSPIYGAIEVGLGLIGSSSAYSTSDGFPFPGYEARIAKKGTLAFRSKGLFSGYLPNVFSNMGGIMLDEEGWFITSDLARQLPDGSFQILGRATSVIKLRENIIIPEEVESLIMELPFVRECLVTAIPPALPSKDGTSGKIRACVVLTEESNPHDEQLFRGRILDHLIQQSSEHPVLDDVYFVENLPKTRTGKLSRKPSIQGLL